MLRFLSTALAILLAVAPAALGQVRNILSLPDRIMSSSRIGRVSKIQYDPIPLPDTSRLVFPTGGTMSISKDFDFFNYLSGEGLDTDGRTLVCGNYAPSDTLDFLRGKVLFSSRRWSQSADMFALVPAASAFGTESFFYRINSLAYLGEYGRASEILSEAAGPFMEGPYKELYHQQGAGLALLRNDIEGWNRHSGGFTYSDYNLEESERIMSEIAVSRFGGNGKHAGLAALMSAVVPGAGKVYAGRFGEGAAAFLTVGSLAAVTGENWHRHGLKDWRTIVAGSLFATFYVGNIYGSYLSVSIEKDERTKAEDSLIIYHLHIPLRSTFR